MAKCSKCDLNEAVIYTSRLDHGQQQSEGYCIKCAFHANIAGLEELFTKAGVNESNIDELTERMNHMMAGMGSRRPEDLFRMILSSDPADMQLDILDEEGRPKEGLLPVARGQENEDERKSDTSVESDTAPSRTRERRKKFLDQFGTNLTAKAAMNGIDRIIGRQTEIARVIQILNRRNKNNPVLLGEPGVVRRRSPKGWPTRSSKAKCRTSSSIRKSICSI